MEEIDWSKAPDDATHHQAGSHGLFECWLKPGYAVRVSRGTSNWVEDNYADHLISTTATARPAQPWSGEGFPPVGVVCEWKEKSGFQWVAATVLFVSEKSIVLQRFDGFEWQEIPARLAFRPIRTPEQIAADEREALAMALYDQITKDCPDLLSSCRKAVAAGWHKQEQPE